MDATIKYQKRLVQSASRYRDIIINTLGNKCQNCNSQEKIVIHHEKYKEGMTINNLKLLCSVCHRKEHYKKDKTKKIDEFYNYIKSKGKEVKIGELQTYNISRATRWKYIRILEDEGRVKYIANKPQNKGILIIK